MIEVEICSLADLPLTIKNWAPDLIVSAVPIRHIPEKQLRLPMDDIYNVQILTYKNSIRDLLKVDDERILIHCLHGISRSSALAIAKLYHEDPDKVDQFLIDHPMAEPNALLLLFADEILKADFDLLRRCSNFYKGRHL